MLRSLQNCPISTCPACTPLNRCIRRDSVEEPRRDAEEYTIATLGLLGLGRPIGSGSSRLLAHGSLLGGGRGLPAGILSHRRLVVSRSRWAGAGSQEDGGRGDVDVLSHQSVPSARGGVAQSHGVVSAWQDYDAALG
jgi:hypothetical protein